MGQFQFKNIEGIQQDISIQSLSGKYAYDIHNLRILNRDNQTLLSIENEKGTQQVEIVGDSIQGTVIGVCVISGYITLFTTDSTDYIYRLEESDNKLQSVLLFSGDLGLSVDNPIESLGYSENEKIIKVYWIDGKNQLRMINIMDTETLSNVGHSYFDVQPDIVVDTNIQVTKRQSGGYFLPGSLKYFFTLSNKYGQESAIFHIAPFEYTNTTNNYGISNEGTSSNSFGIHGTINSSTNVFSYVNIYSAIYTSKNSLPSVKLVAKVKIINNEINYIDTGAEGSLIEDPTTLLFKNGNSYAFGTMATKDKVLYLGNGINLSQQAAQEHITEDIRNYFKLLCNDVSTDDSYRTIDITDTDGTFYDYISDLGRNSNTVKLFKYKEHYRLGVQLMYKDGSWTEPLLVHSDVQYNKNIEIGDYFDNTNHSITAYSFSVNFGHDNYTISQLKAAGYIKIRPVIVYPEDNKRECVCQGVLNPTMYNPKRRYDNTCFAQSSWIFRPNAPYKIKDSAFDYSLDELPVMTDINRSFIIFHEDYYTGTVNMYDKVLGGDTVFTRTFNHATCDDFHLKTAFYMSHSNKVYEYDDSWGEGTPGWVVVADGDIEGVFRLAKINNKTNAYLRCTYSRDSSPNYVSWLEGTVSIIMDVVTWTEIAGATDGGSPAEFRNTFATHKAIYNGSGEQDKLKLFTEQNELLKKRWPYSVEIQSHNYFKTSNRERSVGVPPSNISEELQNTLDYMYIDQSIVTLNSPDIEFNSEFDNMTFDDCKLRIVGMIPITSNSFKADIQIKREDNNAIPIEIIDNMFNPVKNININAWKTLLSYPMIEDVYTSSGWDYNTIVHMFHNKVGRTDTNSSGGVRVSVKTKTFANFKFSYKPFLFNWDDNNKYTNLGNQSLWSNTTIARGTNSGSIIKYSSDVPKLIQLFNINHYYYKNISYYGTVNTAITTNDPYIECITGNNEGYYPMTGGSDEQHSDKASDAIEMNYKASPHLVISLPGYFPTTNNGATTDPSNFDIVGGWIQETLPTINNLNRVVPTNDDYNYCLNTNEQDPYIYYEQKNIASDVFSEHPLGWLWLGEVYRETVENRFGGEDDMSIRNNIWHVAGNSVNLDNPTGNDIIVRWTEGDTYFQRYDCLKTSPYSFEDQNQVIDMLSFMCYTRVNLNGRYDGHQGISNLLYNNMSNVNTINDAYSAEDALSTTAVVFTDGDINTVYENNNIKWSGIKFNGSEEDVWTHINEFNTYDLDGALGPLTAIKAVNDNLIAFQENGVVLLEVDSRKLETLDGTTVELSDTSKLRSHKIIANNVGCLNKWAICQTSKYIYWIDDNNKDIYRLPGKQAPYDNLSSDKGMSSYTYKKLTDNNRTVWNPVTKDNFSVYYDSINEDIFFMDKDNCLAFNERSDTFTSFYDYYEASYFFNFKNNGYFIKNGIIYKEHAGDYNVFFDESTPRQFHITLQSSGLDSHKDKTFNTVEFRGDTFGIGTDSVYNVLQDDIDIDTISAKTEYQEANTDINNQTSSMWGNALRHRNLDKQKLFRMWRYDIPRCLENNNNTGRKLNRIRNPWITLKLESKHSSINRTVLNDFIIHYTE